MQPEVFVRGGGVHAAVEIAAVGATGTTTTDVGVGGASVGMAGTGVTDGDARLGATGAAGEQAVKASATNRIEQRMSTGVGWRDMEVISVASGRPPSVDRPESSTAVFLTFDGLREAKVRDRDTRIGIALQGPQAAPLCGCSASD